MNINKIQFYSNLYSLFSKNGFRAHKKYCMFLLLACLGSAISNPPVLSMEEEDISLESGRRSLRDRDDRSNRPAAKVSELLSEDKIPNPEYFMLGNEQENLGLLHVANISYNMAFEEQDQEKVRTDFRSSSNRKASLSVMHCGGEGLTDQRLADILRFPAQLPKIAFQLTELDLSGNQLTSSCFTALKAFTRIKVLKFSNNSIDDKGIDEIIQFPYLTELIMDNTVITDKGIKKIVENAPNLEKLSLVNIPLTSDAIESLDDLSNLQILILDGSSLTNDRSRAIAAWKKPKRLHTLSLNYCHTPVRNALTYLSTEGVEYISNAPLLSTLTTLNLSNHAIGNEGVKSIMRSNFFPQLKNLCLSYNKIDEKGVKYLLHREHSVQLELLDLSHNKIKDMGVERINWNADKLPHIRELNLENNCITKQGSLKKITEEEFKKNENLIVKM